MKLLLSTVMNYVKCDERQKNIIEKILQPLFDCTEDELTRLIEEMKLASARTFNAAPAALGMASNRIFDDLVRLLYSIKFAP